MSIIKRINRLRSRSLCSVLLSFFASSLLAAPTPISVTVEGDSQVGSGGSFAPYDLRGALNQINQFPLSGGYTINFSITNPISLAAMLPILNLAENNHNNPLTIDGGSGVTIDGVSSYRGFFVNQGTVTLKNLQIQNVLSQGGNGGTPGGGGGMGAGAGLFVRGDLGASVTVSNIAINNASSIGGNGGGSGPLGPNGGGGGLGGGGLSNSNGGNGAAAPSDGQGGGGGLGGNGGNGGVASEGGGGGGINCGTSHLGTGGSNSTGAQGGGILTGSSAGGTGGSNAGGAFGGGGGSSVFMFVGGAGGGGVNGSANTANSGGDGGFGGGGGGASVLGLGGHGGYGGGGGGAGGGSSGGGGAGGFGGGSGGSINAGFGGGGGSGLSPACPGGVGGGASLGSGATVEQGGGGAGLGGAILVDAGATLNIVDSFSNQTGTTNGGNGFVAGFGAGNGCFFLTGAAITFDPNGSSISISNAIADDSPASFVTAPAGVTPGTASGASITIGNPSSNSGTVTLLGDSTYSGATLVNFGTLTLNGSITSPVTVSSGAKLQGTGTVTNTVTVSAGGTIHAGNSPGTFTLDSLTLANNSSILQLDIDLTSGSNSSSIYQVNGPVALNGATLQLLFPLVPPDFSNHTYNFINYVGLSSGTFSTITNVPLGYLAQVNYSPDLVQLNLTPFTVVILVISPNISGGSQSVLNYLLALSTVPSLQPIFNSLALMTQDQLVAAINSISPARNAAATFFTNQAAFGISRMPLARLRDGRVLSHMVPQGKNNSLGAVLSMKSDSLLAMGGEAPIPNQPIGLGQDSDSANSSDLQAPAGQARTAAAKAQNYGFWATGFGDFLSQDGENSNPKIDDTSAGAMIGFDYYGYQNGIFNLAAGYTHNNITEEHHAGSGTSNGAVFSMYGTGYLGNGYLEGGIIGGYNRFHMLRNIVLTGPSPFSATGKSSFNDWMVMPHLGGGYDWMMNWGVVEPFASVDWAVSFQQAYSEKGAFPLNNKIKSQTPSILRSQLGLNVYETWDNATSALIFQQSASYINKTLFNTKMTAAIIIPTALPAGAPTSFTVQSYNKMLNLVGVGAELFYKHKRSGFFLSGAYQGEFGSGYMSNDIKGTLGVFF